MPCMQTWGKSPIRCGIVAIRYGPCSNICHETLELHKSQAARGVCTVRAEREAPAVRSGLAAKSVLH